MSNDPILSRLGFARKAGRLAIGFASSKECVLSGKSKLIVAASDISDKSFKEISYFANGKVTVVKIPNTLDQLSHAIGIKAGIVSVNDEGFATAILKALENNASK